MNLEVGLLLICKLAHKYHVHWLDIVQPIVEAMSLKEQRQMICHIIPRIFQSKRQDRGISMPSTGPMIFIDTARAKQPTLLQMQTLVMSPPNPSYVVSPNDTHPYGQ